MDLMYGETDGAMIAAIEASGTGVVAWDIPRDRVTWLCRPTGILPSAMPNELAFNDLLPLVHPEDRAAFQRRIADLLERGEDYVGETRVVGPDGSVRWLAERGHLERGADGSPLRLTIVAIDVTPARQAEAQLAASRQRFRAIHDLSPDAVIFCTPSLDSAGNVEDFVYTYLNPAALTMARRSEGEMLGRRILEFFPENREQGLHDRYVRVFKTGNPEMEEFAYEGGGLSGWFRSTVLRVGDELAVMVTDISARKAAEAQLRDALQAQTTLMREMNHRVKNSLQMVASLVQLHRMRTRDEGARSAFDDVVARVRAVAEVHRLLYQGDRIGEVDLGNLLRTVTQNVDNVTPGSMAIDLPEEPLTVPVDLAIPVGLITNELVTNAAKHAYGGGPGPIRIHLSRDADGLIRLCVMDEGRGIAPVVETAKSASLGMMLVRSLTDQIDGELAIDSGPSGTCAVVSWRV